MTREYEIGGVCVLMTEEQAARWNSGDTNDLDMLEIEVVIPGRRGGFSSVVDGMVIVEDGQPTTSRVALCQALGDPEIGKQMDCMPANLTR